MHIFIWVYTTGSCQSMTYLNFLTGHYMTQDYLMKNGCSPSCFITCILLPYCFIVFYCPLSINLLHLSFQLIFFISLFLILFFSSFALFCIKLYFEVKLYYPYFCWCIMLKVVYEKYKLCSSPLVSNYSPAAPLLHFGKRLFSSKMWMLIAQTSSHFKSPFFKAFCLLLQYNNSAVSSYYSTPKFTVPHGPSCSARHCSRTVQWTKINLVMPGLHLCAHFCSVVHVSMFVTDAVHQSPYLFCHPTPVPIMRHNLAR